MKRHTNVGVSKVERLARLWLRRYDSVCQLVRNDPSLVRHLLALFRVKRRRQNGVVAIPLKHDGHPLGCDASEGHCVPRDGVDLVKRDKFPIKRCSHLGIFQSLDNDIKRFLHTFCRVCRLSDARYVPFTLGIFVFAMSISPIQKGLGTYRTGINCNIWKLKGLVYNRACVRV